MNSRGLDDEEDAEDDDEYDHAMAPPRRDSLAVDLGAVRRDWMRKVLPFVPAYTQAGQEVSRRDRSMVCKQCCTRAA